LLRDAGEFLCFQCHSRYGDTNRKELREQLLALAAKSGLNIVLTPIARMQSFDDDVFLSSLGADMGNAVRVLPASATIWDLAYAFASTRLFCGTSLHGVITAVAFETPFVPLMSDDPKLANNVQSWGLDSIFPQAHSSELADHGLRSLDVSRGLIAERALQLRRDASANMESLAECILAG
jgi:polysaccharide pyruvyl transferase WcaK-like protein